MGEQEIREIIERLAFDPSASPTSAISRYYSFDHAGWHIVSLNSMLSMREGSEQMTWLREDLSRAEAQRLLAYWHHPRFSSGFRSRIPCYSAGDRFDDRDRAVNTLLWHELCRIHGRTGQQEIP